jgi:hypothetical protein
MMEAGVGSTLGDGSGSSGIRCGGAAVSGWNPIMGSVLWTGLVGVLEFM